MRRAILVFGLLASVSFPAFAEDCGKVAAATVEELEAGAADWNAEQTELARRAAASGCVKAKADSSAESPVVIDDDRRRFLGMPLNKVSGPPSQKPYQRKR